MHWLTQGLRIVNFRWNQGSLWQHSILRETSFYICIEKGGGKKRENISLVCFLLLLKREIKMSDTCSLFLLETPGLPACYPLREIPTVDSRGQAEDSSCSILYSGGIRSLPLTVGMSHSHWFIGYHGNQKRATSLLAPQAKYSHGAEAFSLLIYQPSWNGQKMKR